MLCNIKINTFVKFKIRVQLQAVTVTKSLSTIGSAQHNNGETLFYVEGPPGGDKTELGHFHPIKVKSTT